MKTKDKLHVLPLPKPSQAPAAPQDRPSSTSQDQLATAIAALRGALEAEVAKTHATAPTRPADTEDSFSPIGAPKPLWRTGAEGSRRTGAEGSRRTGAEGSGRVGVARRGGDSPRAQGAVTRPSSDHRADTDTRDPLARRITAIYLPHFAMERWQIWAARQHDAPPQDIPAALATEGTHGSVIHATNRAAEAAGVHKGARVVDMRALCPDLHITFADISGDRAALQKLMLWARRWCPWTAVDGDAGLVLDTTGSDHLWGGEAAMLREMEDRLSRLGLSANIATTPTHGASWALTRMGAVRVICPPGTLAARMAPLPVRALRLDGDTVQLLNRLGLKTVGDLAAVPRISLARRFSRADLPQNPLLRLDQMMGRLAEPVSAADDPPRFAVQANLAEPVQDPTPHLPALCTELCAGLHKAGFGARRVRVSVYRTDGEVSHVTVATSQPTRDAAHIHRLFDDKLDQINPGFGFDLITLEAATTETLQTVQARLDGKADDGAALARLTDRLTARLGAGAVRYLTPHDSHMPERAQDARPALHGKPALPMIRPLRPLRLFDPAEEIRVLYAVPEGPPAQFVWRRVTHKVVRFAGPERIAPEWWRDMPGTRLRDYYVVEDQLNCRLWLYRDGVLGDQRGAVPRWFLHGAFA